MDSCFFLAPTFDGSSSVTEIPVCIPSITGRDGESKGQRGLVLG